MALNASGQISLAGTTAGQSVEVELGGGGTATISLNDSNVRTLLGIPSGAIDLNTAHGKANRVTINLTIAGNTTNYNIFSNRGGTYVAGKSDIVLTINSGVVVGSTSTANAALDTGTGWTAGDTITLKGAGGVYGRGGNGGAGASTNTSTASGGAAGGAGGPAFNMHLGVTLFAGNTLTFGGGGGGGGGGAPGWKGTATTESFGGNGGGSGAGYNTGAVGAGGTATGGTLQLNGGSGIAPTAPSASGGNGGAASGGNGAGGAAGVAGTNGTEISLQRGMGGGGGGLGAAGGSGGNGSGTTITTGFAGGAGGNAINKNGNTITGSAGAVYGAIV